MSTSNSTTPIILAAGLAIGAAAAGYYLGARRVEGKQAQKRDKIVNEIKAEREELLQQLVDNVKKNRRQLIEAETEKLREENRLLRLQINSPGQISFVLYNNDSDPQAQMVWLALLEKRVQFDNRYINIYNKSLEATQKFLEENPEGTLPFAIHGKTKLSNAIDTCWYIDEEFPEPPLSPAESIAKYNMRAIIERNRSITTLWWSVLTELDVKKRPALIKNLEDAIRAFNKDIVGPYILGDSFSLADIFFLPYFERIDVVLGNFRDFHVPADCGQVIRWLKDCHERTSFKITTERTEASIKVLPWSQTDRAAYLHEVYEAVAVGRWPEVQAAMAKSATPLTQQERKALIYQQPQQV